MAQHNELGKKGEKLAVDFLLENGYEIAKRNYRFDKAEIDIIATKEDTLAIIEVKTRSSTVFGFPEEVITSKKKERMYRCAEFFLEEFSTGNSYEIQYHVAALIKRYKQKSIRIYTDL